MAFIKFLKHLNVERDDSMPFEFVDAKLAALNKEMGIIG